MTTYVPGLSAQLTVQWYTYNGGPLSPVTGVTITITPAAGGAPILGPTAVGVTSLGTGLNAYTWTVPALEGDYVVTWDALDNTLEACQAVELVTVATPTDLYVSLATVKASLTKTAVDDRDDLLEQAIRAACRLIDRRTNRRFYADQVASARTFPVIGQSHYTDGGLAQVLLVDDIASATGLVVESGSPSYGTTVTGYETGPDNALVYGRPITELRSTVGWLPVTGRVRITALWGWPAVPDEIASAALMLAARLYKRKDSPQGVIGTPEWGTLRVSRMDPDVEALIAPFVVHVIV